MAVSFRATNNHSRERKLQASCLPSCLYKVNYSWLNVNNKPMQIFVVFFKFKRLEKQQEMKSLRKWFSCLSSLVRINWEHRFCLLFLYIPPLRKTVCFSSGGSLSYWKWSFQAFSWYHDLYRISLETNCESFLLLLLILKGYKADSGGSSLVRHLNWQVSKYLLLTVNSYL